MESDNDNMVLQALDSPTLPSPLQSYHPLMTNPFPGPSSPWVQLVPQKHKAIEMDSLPVSPSTSLEAVALMVASSSTRLDSPVLTTSQQFLKAQTNLPSSLLSIKKGDEDWFTFVKLWNEHKWHYSALTGAALQAATDTLNKVITTLKSTHAV